MKSLTDVECRTWLEPSGLMLNERRTGILDPLPQCCSDFYMVVDTTVDLQYFASKLLDWMPPGHNRLLVMSNWDTYPPDRFHIFNIIRRGCGITELPLAAPGNLFISTKAENIDFDDRPQIDVEEESTAMWLMGLMLDWTWEGFLFAEGSQDVVWLGDGFTRLYTNNPTRYQAGNALLAGSGLAYCKSFPWSSR